MVYRNLATNKTQFIVIYVKAYQYESLYFFYKKRSATVETEYAISLAWILKLGSEQYLLNSKTVHIISVGFIKKGVRLLKLLLVPLADITLNILLLFVIFYKK